MKNIKTEKQKIRVQARYYNLKFIELKQKCKHPKMQINAITQRQNTAIVIVSYLKNKQITTRKKASE